MKTINAKLFALKYKLFTILDESLKADKNAIKEGANITFNNYCKIQQVVCTKSTLDKDKVQELCNTYGIDIATLQKTTTYTRIDIDNIPTEVESKVNDILIALESTNDKTTQRVASGIANTQA